MKMPLDWPRLNQFPEWYVADPETHYALENKTANHKEVLTGVQLAEGIPISVEAGQEIRLIVHRKPPALPGDCQHLIIP